jgi:putative NIF3 family GTP cyclohydrolase 1 type 2
MNLRAPRSDGPSLPISISPHDEFIRTISIIRGNGNEVFKKRTTKVDCVITSPAYYQQRNLSERAPVN